MARAHWIHVLVAATLATLGCGEGELQVRGALDRVVGETITLELAEGDEDFAGKVTLVAADNTSFSSTQLSVTRQSARSLSFVVPPNIMPGAAVARVARSGGAGTYLVPLRINRLALTLDGLGLMEVLPLPPATLQGGNESVGSGKSLFSLAPGGGTLALLAGDKLRLMTLGPEVKDLSAAITLTGGGQCLTAIPGGMLVGSATQITLLRQIKGKGISRQMDFNIAGCQDIAVDNNGSKALVLTRWDSDQDKAVDSDALTEITLGASPSAHSTRKLDAKPSAKAVGLTGDGLSAVVVDNESVYGVSLLGGGSFKLSTLPWGFSANPVALARSHALSPVSGQSVQLFALAELSGKRVHFVGVDRGRAKWIFSGSKRLEVDLSLQGPPSALAFGRRLELYVAIGKLIYKVNGLEGGTPKIVSLGLSAKNSIKALAVQP